MNRDAMDLLGSPLAISPITGSSCLSLHYSTTSGNCTTETITKLAAEISAFIKTIDTNHLVGIGDEGYFNDPGSSDYPYQYDFP